MVAPSKHHAFSIYSSNSPYRSFPPQYHPSAPTSAPLTSPRYYGTSKPTRNALGTSATPSSHGVNLFNEDVQKRGDFNSQDVDTRYQYASPSSADGGGTYIDTSATAPPSNTPSQNPYQQQCQYYSPLNQPWNQATHAERGYHTPSAFIPQCNENTPETYLTTTPPSTGLPKGVQGGGYIGTPSTPPPSEYPHISSPDLTTSTTEACACYRAAIETPLTPFYPSSSPAVASPMSGGSESGGVLVGECEKKGG
ncbi:hypothetical protein V491_06505, partial [Pseudogymnoascus sp. VKM F-3775]